MMLQNASGGVKRKPPPPDVGSDPSRGAATQFSPGLKSWVRYGKQGTKSRRDDRKAALIRLPHQAKPGFATDVEGAVEIESAVDRTEAGTAWSANDFPEGPPSRTNRGKDGATAFRETPLGWARPPGVKMKPAQVLVQFGLFHDVVLLSGAVFQA